MARGDFRQRVVFELEDQATGKARAIESSFDKISKAALALGITGAAGKALSAFTGFLQDGSRAAIEQERVNQR